jgi:hypothetical protein
MIEFEIENNGCFAYEVEIKKYGAKIHFYGKNYNTNTDDYVIIRNIIYKDLILPELFEYTTMTTDSDNDMYQSLTNVNYISFNGIWELKFTDNDIKKILKKKLT